MNSALIKAFRLRTLPLAAGAVLLGSLLAYLENSFSFQITLLTLLTAFSLQILSNLANDYGDFVNGADAHGRADRAVASGGIPPEKMKKFLIINAIVTLALGIALLLYAGSQSAISFWGMFLLGLGCIAAALLYTIGKRPYGYAGLGDLSVLIFFGFVAVSGSAYLQTGIINIDWMIPAISFGLLCVAVLNINNIRDIETDLAAAKKSIAARLGFHIARKYQVILIVLALAGLITFTLKNSTDVRGLFVLLIPVAYFRQLAKLYTLKPDDRSAFNKLLKELSLSNLFLVCLVYIVLA